MNLTSEKSAIGEAHSKIILFGEHAVVYGKSAIAIPFPLKMKTDIIKATGDITISSFLYNGTLENAPKEMKGVCKCIEEAFLLLKKPLMDVCFEFHSEIPMGRGLGSSAAAATSVVRAIYNYFHEPLKQEELYYLVGLSESYAHGKPSGIDMMAVTSDVPIVFTKEMGASRIQEEKEFFLIVADTGMIGGTRMAVERVRAKQEANKKRVDIVLDEMNDIANCAKEAIIRGDAIRLGKLMNENHVRLVELGVSNEILDSLVETAVSHGAIGAKLTGGGMGGCMISISNSMEESKSIAKALSNAGAKQVWYFSTKSQEIYSNI